MADSEETTTEVSTGSTGSPAEPVEAPLLRVVKGDLEPEELAALVAVVQARRAAAANAAVPPRQPRSEWGHPARAARTPLRVGPDQWRRSSWA